MAEHSFAHTNMADKDSLEALKREGDLLSVFARDIGNCGLVGEGQNAQKLLLAMVSAKMLHPLNVTVQGASSAGKNYVIDATKKFMPTEMVKSLSGMTPKVLMHAAKDEYKHKVVIIAEHEGAAAAEYAIRTFQSEKQIQWDFVESGQSGIKKKTNVVEGPAAFIEATTRTTLHPDNETRQLFLHIDESPDQTRRILMEQALRAAGHINDCARSVHTRWQTFIRSLTVADVTVPWAARLAQQFPTGEVRARRDFPKLLSLAKASAFLHQYSRDRDRGCVVASADDYRYVLRLFRRCFESGPDAGLRSMLAVAETLKTYKIEDLIAKLRWGQSKVYELHRRAFDAGLVMKGAGWGYYEYVSSAPEYQLELPETLE